MRLASNTKKCNHVDGCIVLTVLSRRVVGNRLEVENVVLNYFMSLKLTLTFQMGAPS